MKSNFRGAVVPVSLALLAFSGVSWCNWRDGNRLQLFYPQPRVELLTLNNVDARRYLPESREVRVIYSEARERVPVNPQHVAHLLAAQQFNACSCCH